MERTYLCKSELIKCTPEMKRFIQTLLKKDKINNSRILMRPKKQAPTKAKIFCYLLKEPWMLSISMLLRLIRISNQMINKLNIKRIKLILHFIKILGNKLHRVL